MLTERQFRRLINPQDTPDVGRRRPHKVRGKRTRIGLRLFAYNCFKLNEETWFKTKMTNTEIKRQLLLEFRHHEKTKKGLEKNNPSINDLRHLYNKGVIGVGLIPDRLSVRWGKIDGVYVPVDLRSGRKPLEAKDILTLCIKYEKYHRLNELSFQMRERLLPNGRQIVESFGEKSS